MAVKDDDVYHPTDGLVLSQPRPHYRTSVVPTHWQLRSLVGSEKNNLVYFPSGSSNTHIKCLNTTTYECETIKLLSFEPRCLVARKGWLCCGGETGDFTAIRLDQSRDSGDPADSSGMVEPILRSPLSPPDLEPSQSDLFSLRPRPRQPRMAQSKTFGKERVNCITIWFPPTLAQRFDGAYQEPVAVLANNDKSVTTVSLRNEEPLDEIVYNDCVNRAVMSPDGRLLVAVCDDPYLYIRTRTKQSSGETRRDYQWDETRKIHLKGQIQGDRSDNRGSFALCFNSTGSLLAVGTQYGRISIFNVETLAEPGLESLITSFKSSRSDIEIGAVRDMAFAPGPIDLLAWSEDRGHIGVADLRTGFVSRQILYLENQDDYDHVDTVINSPSGLSNSFIDPRLLDGGTGATGSNDVLSSTFANNLDLSFDTARSHTRELLDRYSTQLSNSNSPLTPEETRVLEALQEHRRRRELRAAERAAARVSTQTTPAPRLPWIERNIRSTTSTDPATTRSGDRSQSNNRLVSDILGSVREQLRDAEDRQAASSRSVRDILGTVRDQLRTTEERLQGLQASIRESREATRDAPDNERSPSRRTPAPRLLSTSITPPPGTSSGGWADLDALYNLSFENSNTTFRSLRDSAIIDAETRLRRERMNRLMRDYQMAHPAAARHHSMLRERSDPHDTAGLSWSENGQTLFVGAVNGIYEFKVNMLRRRTFPSLTSR